MEKQTRVPAHEALLHCLLCYCRTVDYENVGGKKRWCWAKADLCSIPCKSAGFSALKEKQKWDRCSGRSELSKPPGEFLLDTAGKTDDYGSISFHLVEKIICCNSCFLGNGKCTTLFQYGLTVYCNLFNLVLCQVWHLEVYWNSLEQWIILIWEEAVYFCIAVTLM